MVYRYLLLLFSDEIGCVRSMNLPDWVSNSNLGAVSNNDSNNLLPFPSKSQSNPIFPMPSSPSIVPPPNACSQQHAPTHSLTYITPPPPTTTHHPVSPLQPYITALSSDTAHTLLPRHATLRHRPPTPASTRLQPHHHHLRRRLQELDPRPDHAALCCVSRKRPLRTRRYRPGAAVLLAARRRLCPARRTSGV